MEVTTNSPQGFIKSPVAQYAPQEYYVNVTWTPMSSEIETKLFCFTGLEDSGYSYHWAFCLVFTVKHKTLFIL